MTKENSPINRLKTFWHFFMKTIQIVGLICAFHIQVLPKLLKSIVRNGSKFWKEAIRKWIAEKLEPCIIKRYVGHKKKIINLMKSMTWEDFLKKKDGYLEKTFELWRIKCELVHQNMLDGRKLKMIKNIHHLYQHPNLKRNWPLQFYQFNTLGNNDVIKLNQFPMPRDKTMQLWSLVKIISLIEKKEFCWSAVFNAS